MEGYKDTRQRTELEGDTDGTHLHIRRLFRTDIVLFSEDLMMQSSASGRADGNRGSVNSKCTDRQGTTGMPMRIDQRTSPEFGFDDLRDCTILATDQKNDLVAHLCGMLYVAVNKANTMLEQGGVVEIEGRIGRILYKEGKRRVLDLCYTETAFQPGYDTMFLPGVTKEYWEHIVDNFKKVQITQGRPYTHEYSDVIDDIYKKGLNSYRVTRTVQSDGSLVRVIFNPPNHLAVSDINGLSLTSKKSNPSECILKRRIYNIDILRPRFNVDFRVDINVETKVPISEVNKLSSVYNRSKQRYSYSNRMFRTDLTKVSCSTGHGAYSIDETYEIEQEMLRSALVELEKSIHNQKNNLEKVVDVFLKNLRSLDYIGATYE